VFSAADFVRLTSPTLKEKQKHLYKFFAAANINKKELFREFLQG